MKKYIAKVKYINHIFTMFVSGRDEESVMKELTDFYMDLLEDDKNIVEIKLEEIKKDE